MKSKKNKPVLKKSGKAKEAEAEDHENSLDASKQSLEHRIKALKKIIRQLSDNDKSSS